MTEFGTKNISLLVGKCLDKSGLSSELLDFRELKERATNTTFSLGIHLKIVIFRIISFTLLIKGLYFSLL